MEDEKRIEELKRKVLNKIPNLDEKLKQMIATRSFSEEELIKLLSSVTAIKKWSEYGSEKEKLKKQEILGDFFTNP